MAAYLRGDPDALDTIRRLEAERDHLRELVRQQPALADHSSGALLDELTRRGWDVTAAHKLVIADVRPIRGHVVPGHREGVHRLGGEAEVWQAPGRVLR